MKKQVRRWITFGVPTREVLDYELMKLVQSGLVILAADYTPNGIRYLAQCEHFPEAEYPPTYRVEAYVADRVVVFRPADPESESPIIIKKLETWGIGATDPLENWEPAGAEC